MAPILQHHHHHNELLVLLSVLIAIFASYTALDLANSITSARGRARLAWLAGGSIAMGVGIWSMHFVGMLAFSLPGIPIAYDVPLLILSILVAIGASAFALQVVGGRKVALSTYILGSLAMGAAIAGMHYIGVASMRMAATVEWDSRLVLLSILIAVGASFAALWLAFRLRNDLTTRGFLYRGASGALMGIAISGMHYTAMAAMTFIPTERANPLESEQLLATDGLAVAVVGTTLIILAIAIAGSIVERALARRIAVSEKVTRILESITDGFFSVDRQWRFTYINRVAMTTIRRVLTDESSSILGKDLWETIPELRGTRFEEEYRRAMSGGRAIHFEALFERSGIWSEVHAYPSSEGLSVYFRDVTSRKRDEQALREAIRARDEFLSIASHELKTPLTSLKLQAQMRMRNLEKGQLSFFEPERLRTMIRMDTRQVDRLTRLVDDMLDIARISTGRLTIQREPCDLGELVREALERHSEQLAKSGSEVQVEITDEAKGAWDRFRVEQVITNLLTNALKYGAGKPISISVRREGELAVLTVRDQGIGIAPENQERIFQRFERAVSSDEISGLGLGLYIVRQIIEMHGGTISVESELGKGATFRVSLPLAAKADR